MDELETTVAKKKGTRGVSLGELEMQGQQEGCQFVNAAEDGGQTTNCSETMSTNDEGEQEVEFEQEHSRRQESCSIAMRPQTPRRVVLTGHLITDTMSGLSERDRSNHQLLCYTNSNQNIEPDYGETLSNMSLASVSAANYAPPSYGTATRFQPQPLDASQLDATSSWLAGQTNQAAAIQNYTRYSARTLNNRRQELETSGHHLVYNEPIRASISLPRLQLLQRIANSEQLQPPEINGSSTSAWSSSSSANKAACQPLYAAPVASVVSGHRQPESSGTEAESTDNNRLLLASWRQSDQAQLINHVISARGSLIGEQVANQYYAAHLSSLASSSTSGGTLLASVAATATSAIAGQRFPEAPLMATTTSNHWPSPPLQQQQQQQLQQGRLDASRSISDKQLVSAIPATANSISADSHKQRKRRRHRSATSGGSGQRRSLSPPANFGRPHSGCQDGHRAPARSATMQLASSSSRVGQQAISAHCWLIDSSDDNQTYCSAAKRQHLTVAMMRQAERRKQEAASMLATKAAPTTSNNNHNYNSSDIAADLKTNSLRMEKILNRKQCQQETEAKRRRNHPKRHPKLSETSGSSLSLADIVVAGNNISGNNAESRRENSNPSTSTLLRLSTLLSLLSGLVKVPKTRQRSRSMSRSHRPLTKTTTITDTGNMAHSSVACPVPPANSVNSQSAPYIANSSIAYSSSTSAYATGSSRLSTSSHGLAPSLSNSRQQQQQDQQVKQPAILLSQFGKVAHPALFYSASSGNSLAGFPAPPSTHAYEYCEDNAMDETQFQVESNQLGQSYNGNHKQCSPDSTLSNTNNSTSTSTTTGSSGIGRNDNRSSLANPMTLMSDHELISSVGEESRGNQNQVFAAVVAARAASQHNKGWWWLKAGHWFKCSSSATSASDHATATPLGTNPSNSTAEAAATRYKTLRSKRRRHSLWRNIVALAKADSVFRWRLIASIVVSCILMALICLLVALVYSQPNYSGLYNRFLVEDSSSYDLGWLWPPQTQLLNAGQISKTPNYRNIEGGIQTKNPSDSLDNSLRAQLALIESSGQLEEFEQTMKHLTNIQLANDNFIDLTQLAKHLDDGASSRDNEQSSINRNTGFYNNKTTNKRKTRIHLNQVDLNLVSLTLLSNLHWPLVKWRHQSQQSMANFLSFALPPSSSTFGGSQTVRNLLAMMLLSQSTDADSRANYHLSQFERLNWLLQTTGHHLISCTYSLQRQQQYRKDSLFREQSSLRRTFCLNLINRYRKMMLTLTQLNHNHLFKLHNPMEPFQHTLAASLNGDSSQTSRSSRTLLGFLLDRLSLLDVNAIAEMTIANSEWLESFSNLELMNTIETLVQSQEIARMKSKQSFPAPNEGSLITLAKLLIGEDPMRLNINLEVNQEFRIALQRLEMEHYENWRETLASSLLYPWNSFNIPQFVIPTNYDLFLHPNLTSKLVLGMVKIEFKLERPTRFIIINFDKLNLVDLTIWSKQIDNSQNRPSNHSSSNTLQSIPIRRVLVNPKLEQLYIELHDLIEPHYGTIEQQTNSNENQQFSSINFGEIPATTSSSTRDSLFVISISFNKTNLINDMSNNDGLEFVQYGDYFAQPEAEMKTMLFTKFEPTNARRTFPCFDEPQFKARFQLNLVHEQNHQVLFNAPKRERVPYTSNGELQMSVFEPTPIPFSTYLIAFVVCDSQNIKSITTRALQYNPILHSGQIQTRPLANRGETNQRYTQVQILAQFELLSQAEFASQLVPQLLTFYQSHLQFTYPMDKLDLVAIPKQLNLLSSLASTSSTNLMDTMENLGLMWFKAPLLLMDTNLINQNLIEQISMLISHQVAHQFFGNIVTVRYWQDLWLYESLCQYLESIAMSSVESDWKLEEQFVVTTIQETLTMAAFQHHPVQLDSSQPLDLLQQANSHSNSDEQLASEQPTSTSGQFLPQTDYNNHHAPSVDSSLLPLVSMFTGTTTATTTTTQTATPKSLDSTLAVQEELNYYLDSLQESSSFSFDSASTTTSAGATTEIGNGNRLRATIGRSTFELKRNSALLHMLLFNLLPSLEAQARLFRRCLQFHRYSTMSGHQFWKHFGQQLAQEASLDRVSLDLSKFSGLFLSEQFQQPLEVTGFSSQEANEEQESEHQWQLLRQTQQQTMANTTTSTNEERVVFVRGSKETRQSEEDNDSHPVRAGRSSKLVDNLDAVANVWLERQGFPLITVSVFRDRIQLRQERFSLNWWNEMEMSAVEEQTLPTRWTGDSLNGNYMNNLQGEHTTDLMPDDIWPIPLMFLSRFNPKQARFLWMSKREMELPYNSYYHTQQQNNLSENNNGNYWFKLNVNQSSLVRVNYDYRNWESLSDLLMKSHYSNHLLGPLDRANLIDDALTLMRCGKLSVGIAMNLTLYLEVGERDYMPWISALRHLDQMQTLLNQNPLWHRYVLKLLQPISSVIGWKDDGPHPMRKLRRNLFSVALQYGDEKTINKAKQEFKGWLKSSRFIVPNLQELVYVAGVRYGDQQEWFHCWQKYQQLVALDISSGVNSTASNSAGSSGGGRSKQTLTLGNIIQPVFGSSEVNEPNAENEKRQLLTALASTQNTWLLEQFLNYSLDSSKVQSRHLKHVMQTLGKNPVARLYLWRFVRLNWMSLLDRFLVGDEQRSQFNSRRRSLRYTEARSMDFDQALETMIIESTKHFASKLDYEEVKSFFEAKRHSKDQLHWDPGIEQAIQQSLQIIKLNIYWRDYIEPKLAKWLSYHHSATID